MKNFIYIITALLLVNCGPSEYYLQYKKGITFRTQVEIFSSIDQSSKTFKPLKLEGVSMEEQYQMELIANALIEDGWISDEKSPFVLNAQMSIDDGTRVTSKTPVFGQVPTGNSTKQTTVNVNPYGNSATVNSKTKQQTVTGVTGYKESTRTVYKRKVSIIVLKDSDSNEVWKCNLTSSGSTSNLREVLPYMLSTLTLVTDERYLNESVDIGSESIHALEFKKSIGAY